MVTVIRLARVVVAVLLAAAAYVALPAVPASAAGCSTANGVTVVVDFHQLGGGVQSGCVSDGGGRTAAQLFPAAGHALSYVQRQPGFVCQVDGVPADDPCVNTPPADAYWGLYWSDGKSGSWSYSTSGAGGLRVPDGGYVAFSWQGSSTRALPGYAPTPRPKAPATPTRTPSPSSQPSTSQQPDGSSAPPTVGSTDGPSGSVSAEASKAPKPGKKKPRADKSASATPSGAVTASPSASVEDAVPTSAEATDADDGGLPGWVAPVVIVVLFGVAGGAAVVRRRSAS